eukprot:PhF_6_TR7280/c0_g1_i1/m.10871
MEALTISDFAQEVLYLCDEVEILWVCLRESMTQSAWIQYVPSFPPKVSSAKIRHLASHFSSLKPQQPHVQSNTNTFRTSSVELAPDIAAFVGQGAEELRKLKDEIAAMNAHMVLKGFMGETLCNTENPDGLLKEVESLKGLLRNKDDMIAHSVSALSQEQQLRQSADEKLKQFASDLQRTQEELQRSQGEVSNLRLCLQQQSQLVSSAPSKSNSSDVEVPEEYIVPIAHVMSLLA